MRLKSLDIKGFKSFADKTQVVLDHAVTGIVGPNGCGKSNIVDAIRWVIGEHKIKSLRSDNLDDLVFNGSKSRSAAGMAEVSLTFENTRNLLPTEFSTVTVTRKFYKSGESEYRLNDVTCRLKDIHNLFLDTGVSNDSYAIIELGMVDDIIKDKEGSRRRMLEQAAGISIYKTRKKEAKQKLEATQQDIDRIEDILYEIGNNMRTLESQARKAERYLQIKTEYKEISLELARVALQEFNERYQDINGQIEQEEAHRIKVSAEIADDEAQIEANKVKLANEEVELARAQKMFNDLVNRIRNLESEKKLSAQHLRHLQEREQHLRSYINNARQQLQQLNELTAISTKQLSEAEEEQAVLRDDAEDLHEALEDEKQLFDGQKQLLEQKRLELQELQVKHFDAEKKSAVADNTLNNLKRDCLRLELERNKRDVSLAQLEGEKASLAGQVQQKESEIKACKEQQEAMQQQALQLQESLESAREEQLAASRQLDARQNEYDLLKSLMDSLDGYPESIRFLKKNKEWQKDAPLLSDVFSVPKDYRVALEAVLEQYLNYYVVAGREDALEAVALLSRQKKGKASFLLLNRLTTQKIRLKNIPKGFVAAIDVAGWDEAYQPLAEYLLSNVLIAEEAGSLNAAALPEGFIYVSKDGSVQKRDHVIIGGSVGAFEGNKIGRAKNLSVLANDIKELAERVALVSKRKEDTQAALQAARQELKNIDLDKLRREQGQLQGRLQSVDSKIEHLHQLNYESAEQLASLQEKLNDYQQDISGDQAELESLSRQLSEFKTALQQVHSRYTEAEQAYNIAAQKYNQHQLLRTKQQSKIEQIKQEQGFRAGQMANLEKQINRNKEELEEASEQISQTSGKLNFGDDELEELLVQKEKESKALNERDRAYYAARNEVKEHEHRIAQQRKAKEQAEVLVNGLKEKLTEMKLQVAGMKERLQVEFKVDLEEVLEQPRSTELDLDELNKESERLKKRLDSMGEVNATAIEAYQEIKLRFDFIHEQKGDLENARDTLLATIEEVEQTANSRFEETFEKVRENFAQVFKALFTEDDSADLRLTDPENMADTGIEIYAQPKGKRPSTLTQLSGGEKTLTSTAFLFAIYLIKPAPFCILDEVDAPLDDANVSKFTGMIRKFSDNSQFIIITHNKQTMASVDVIYGVTMQEAGVSKIVPVDFRSLN
ncbi:MAG TPA: chromosome segregation protein SMC [Edaphocola sp.]|nr:chromosome segregation protein SMC [Edaphocola sp.]